MRALGVDPGVSGALAIVDDSMGVIACVDMPVVEIVVARKKRKLVDAEATGAWLRDWCSREIGVAVIEDVYSYSGEGSVSGFGFGRSKGVVEGAIAAVRLPVEMTPPATWKAAMGVTSEKETSLQMARDLWPEDAELFRRKKDDGRAEACLLAVYGLRVLAERGAA